MEEMNMCGGKRIEIRRLRPLAHGMPDEAHPRDGDRVVILCCGAVMLRESLNSLHHARESLFLRVFARINPGQADVLAMVEHFIGNPERLECLAEVLIGPGFRNACNGLA